MSKKDQLNDKIVENQANLDIQNKNYANELAVKNNLEADKARVIKSRNELEEIMATFAPIMQRANNTENGSALKTNGKGEGNYADRIADAYDAKIAEISSRYSFCSYNRDAMNLAIHELDRRISKAESNMDFASKMQAVYQGVLSETQRQLDVEED
ncbi:hypothetical protein [Listeria booriae]|uniref:hypothetical protein n=1 Tax=Listeria booriae TaxID=1552123 RepID=UPI001626822C|nr:hypothetical protein [Listeria booriae]MBC1227593.1 hypothetical protein [Listeria booriae]